MSELQKKIDTSIKYLQNFQPDEPYYLCYSGGKDSDCIRVLSELANVKFELHHNLTTVDSPETVAYVKSIPNIIIDKARWNDGTHKTMWNLIVYKKMPPTRLARYCCEHLKESGGNGRLKITGVRKAESINRRDNGGLVKILGKPKTTEKYLSEIGADYTIAKKGGILLNYDDSDSRRAVEHCYRTTSTMINPIIDWSTADVWEFLHHYNVENPLYHFNNRVGCVGCPMQGGQGMRVDFIRYPKIRDNYVRAFDKMLINRQKCGLDSVWKNGIDVLRWWVGEDTTQQRFFNEPYLDGLDL